MTPDLFPFRTAILGESNYTAPENFSAQLVVECVKCHLTENDDPNFSRFATKILRLAFNEEIEPNVFWNNVAFYNFVQELVGEAARERPTSEMWRNSMTAFYELIEKLCPQRLWVLGRANWMNLLTNVEHRQINSTTVLLPNAGGVIASYTNHPSSSLKYVDWRPVVRKLLFEKHNTALQPTSGRAAAFFG